MGSNEQTQASSAVDRKSIKCGGFSARLHENQTMIHCGRRLADRHLRYQSRDQAPVEGSMPFFFWRAPQFTLRGKELGLAFSGISHPKHRNENWMEQGGHIGWNEMMASLTRAIKAGQVSRAVFLARSRDWGQIFSLKGPTPDRTAHSRRASTSVPTTP